MKGKKKLNTEISFCVLRLCPTLHLQRERLMILKCVGKLLQNLHVVSSKDDVLD